MIELKLDSSSTEPFESSANRDFATNQSMGSIDFGVQLGVHRGGYRTIMEPYIVILTIQVYRMSFGDVPKLWRLETVETDGFLPTDLNPTLKKKQYGGLPLTLACTVPLFLNRSQEGISAGLPAILVSQIGLGVGGCPLGSARNPQSRNRWNPSILLR